MTAQAPAASARSAFAMNEQPLMSNGNTNMKTHISTGYFLSFLPSLDHRDIAIQFVRIVNVQARVRRIGRHQHVTVPLERVAERHAKVLGHAQAVRVLQLFRLDDLEEDVIAEDLCGRGTVIHVQIVCWCAEAEHATERRGSREG